MYELNADPRYLPNIQAPFVVDVGQSASGHSADSARRSSAMGPSGPSLVPSSQYDAHGGAGGHSWSVRDVAEVGVQAAAYKVDGPDPAKGGDLRVLSASSPLVRKANSGSQTVGLGATVGKTLMKRLLLQNTESQTDE